MGARKRGARTKSNPKPRPPAPPAPDASLSTFVARWAPPLLALVSAIVFSGVVDAGFAYDDHSVVLGDPDVTGGRFWAVWDGWARPVRTVTLMLDHALFAAQPLGYHIHSLLWHIACVLGVYALALRLLARPLPAFATALLFAVHPVHVEAVVNVANRKEPLCLAFSLLALLLYMSAADRRGRERGWRLVAAVAAWVVALYAKQVAVALPLTAVLYDLLFLTPERRLLLRWPRLLLAGAGLAGVALAGFLVTTLDWSNLAANDSLAGYLGEPTIAAVALSSAQAFWRYLGLLVWPAGLCPDHVTVLPESLADPGAWIAWGAMALFVVGSVWVLRRDRVAGFGLLWLWLHWLPVSNLVPAVYMLADRYLYVPSVGFCLAVVALGDLARRVLAARAPDLVGPLVAAGLALVLGASVVMTRAYVPHWRGDPEVWSYTLRCEPRSFRAHNNVGNYRLMAGRYAEAAERFDDALALRPGSAPLHFNRGIARAALGRHAEAIEDFDAALEGIPHPAAVHRSRARSRLARGHATAALRDYERALGLEPENAEGWAGQGFALEALGHADAAVEAWRRALSINPRHRGARAALSKADEAALRPVGGSSPRG